MKIIIDANKLNLSTNDYAFETERMYENSTHINNHINNLFEEEEYIFDRTDVRIIFITIYSIVFCCCFFGNLLVILVVALSRRLRSNTNFFLANLAVADFCVGIFCVYQNLSIYLIPTWVLGDFLCKMYQFIHSLSYTASIFILIVICTERYLAIVYPITFKEILTPIRLKMVIVGVWLTSAAYSAPRFFWVQTIENHLFDGKVEIICTTHRKKYNSKLFDIINFVLLYCLPLAIMMILYTRIATVLYQSSCILKQNLTASIKSEKQSNQPFCSSKQSCRQMTSHCQPRHEQLYAEKLRHFTENEKISLDEKAKLKSGASPHLQMPTSASSLIPLTLQHPNSVRNVLRARRRVIRMLVLMVLTFALCNLPFHARKMWQYWSSGYRGSSTFSMVFTPVTFLITYINSGANPLLYALLSRNFRRGMMEIFICYWTPTKRRSSNKYFNNSPQHKEEIFDQNIQGTKRCMLQTHSTTITFIQNSMSDSYSTV